MSRLQCSVSVFTMCALLASGFIGDNVLAQYGTISNFKALVNGNVKQPNQHNYVYYNGGATIAVAATCEVENDLLHTIQFFCKWRLHQAPFTISMDWDPLLDPGHGDNHDGIATKQNAHGDWFGGVEIKYQSGTQILSLATKSVIFIENGGGGGGGGVPIID